MVLYELVLYALCMPQSKSHLAHSDRPGSGAESQLIRPICVYFQCSHIHIGYYLNDAHPSTQMAFQELSQEHPFLLIIRRSG